jgi:hypothetical protein
LARKSRASLRDVSNTGCDNNAHTLVLRAPSVQPAEMEEQILVAYYDGNIHHSYSLGGNHSRLGDGLSSRFARRHRHVRLNMPRSGLFRWRVIEYWRQWQLLKQRGSWALKRQRLRSEGESFRKFRVVLFSLDFIYMRIYIVVLFLSSP